MAALKVVVKPFAEVAGAGSEGDDAPEEPVRGADLRRAACDVCFGVCVRRREAVSSIATVLAGTAALSAAGV